jgi:muramoyltetrapeptide carboxypeptidase
MGCVNADGTSSLVAGRRPARLRPGDTVAIVAPSGPAPPAELDAGIAVIESWGLRVVEMPHVRAVHHLHDYLAGADDARAEDFAAAWLDPDVRGIICARGGYGSQRMIDRVDWDALAPAEPKVLVGYSDVTALHFAVTQRLGVVTLHGPMPATKSFATSPTMQAHLLATLFEPESVQRLGGRDAHALVGGIATGVTTGGCVSMLTTSVGTSAFPAAAGGGLVLLEDVNEHAYRLDSYLTHLRRCGWFDGAAGIVLGSWDECEPAEPVVLDILGDLGVPILADLGFGHGADPLTVALGAVAELDADAGSLTFREPALA